MFLIYPVSSFVWFIALSGYLRHGIFDFVDFGHWLWHVQRPQITEPHGPLLKNLVHQIWEARQHIRGDFVTDGSPKRCYCSILYKRYHKMLNCHCRYFCSFSVPWRSDSSIWDQGTQMPWRSMGIFMTTNNGQLETRTPQLVFSMSSLGLLESAWTNNI